jgi:hypothetical protein
LLYKPGLVADGKGALSYTKHYFAGVQRVSSKIGTTTNLGQFLQDLSPLVLYKTVMAQRVSRPSNYAVKQANKIKKTAQK